jgi:hypothetical protein
MNADRISKLLNARPFKPFMVQVGGAEDEPVFVDDPTLAKLEDGGDTLIVTPHRGSSPHRWTKIVDLRLVAVVAVQEGKHEPSR